MPGNTFGEIFKVTTFGESHGEALGCVIDGCPAGIGISREKIQTALNRRKPGAQQTDTNGNQIFNASVTARKEADEVEILSGVFEGKSEGTPIALLIRNTSQHSKDYDNLKDTFRPSHADYTYFEKYGTRDYRGGGRSSGRETAARVAAGAVAQMMLDSFGIKITAYTERAAGVSINKTDYSQIEQNPLRAPDNEASARMNDKIESLRKEGDSAGGIIACTVTGVPAGLGEPVFDKLDAEIAHAMLSIGAIKGIEFGSGFAAADSTGSTNNDAMRVAYGTGDSKPSQPVFLSNNAGGILGGISNGNDIFFRVAVKPVPSIFKTQKTVKAEGTPFSASHDDNRFTTTDAIEESSLRSESSHDASCVHSQSVSFSDTEVTIEGRHDVCLCPRIVPVVEAMTAIVLADMMLRNRTSQ
jgi:chorismate synthase